MLAMALAGLCFDSFMAMMGASITEVRGLDMALVGSALGFGGMLQNIGRVHAAAAGQYLERDQLERALLAVGGGRAFATLVLLSYRGRGGKFG